MSSWWLSRWWCDRFHHHRNGHEPTQRALFSSFISFRSVLLSLPPNSSTMCRVRAGCFFSANRHKAFIYLINDKSSFARFYEAETFSTQQSKQLNFDCSFSFVFSMPTNCSFQSNSRTSFGFARMELISFLAAEKPTIVDGKTANLIRNFHRIFRVLFTGKLTSLNTNNVSVVHFIRYW